MRTSKTIAIIVLGLLVSACADSIPEVGTEFYEVVPRTLIKTAANLNIVSTGVTMATDKTLSDHFVSYQTGKDCSTVRVEQGRTYCREDEPNPIPNVHCYRTIGDVTCYSEPDPQRKLDDRIGNLR